MTGHFDQLSNYDLMLVGHRLMNTKKIKVIGWDYDKKDHKIVKTALVIAKRFGEPSLYETRKGYHIKIRLKEPVSLYRAFQIRYYMKDDYHRLCRDMLKAMGNSSKIIDVLFDLKEVRRKSILE